MTATNILSLPEDVYFIIFTFLTLNDLKECRLTCRQFRNNVNASLAFKKRSELTINDKNISKICERIECDKNSLSFRNLQLRNIRDGPEIAYIMNAVKSEVHRLRLNNAPQIHETLVSIEMPELRELSAINFQVLENEGLPKFNFPGYGKLISLDLKCLRTKSELKQDILRQAIREGGNLKLKRLSIEWNDYCATLILEILNLSAGSLNALEIYFNDSPRKDHQQPWTEICKRLTALRALKLSGVFSAAHWVDLTLKALPETVNLSCIALGGLVGINDDVTEFILKRHQNSLQDVDLAFCKDITSRGFEELRRTTGTLRSLNLLYCRGIPNNSLLSFASDPRTALQELNLTDLVQITEDCMCRLAENLPNLVSLNLRGCVNGVTDKSLAYVFRHQTNLRLLDLTNCYQVGDLGLRGLGEDQWPLPMPIKRLKGLNTLILRLCKRVTSLSLINVFEFKELRKLNLSECDQITNEGINQLTLNCPAIEILHLCDCALLTDTALDTISTNLKRLRKISVSFCRRITKNGVDNFLQNCESLKAAQSSTEPLSYAVL